MRVVLVALVLAAVPSLALAEATEEEARAACTPEALKFCAADVPDRTKVERCLRANIARISPDCRIVMNGGSPGRQQ
jgi:hypothetical protein